MLTGFWHGADWNFILWGLYFAFLLVVEKLFLLKHLSRFKIINHVYVLLLVIISFVIFNASSLKEAVQYIGGMFGAGNYPLISAETVFYFKNYSFVLILALIGATPVPKWLTTKAKFSLWLEPVVLVALLIIVTAYLVDGSFNPFLYFRF
jgi:alginate O-acetyltransferase complex protein AlgI